MSPDSSILLLRGLARERRHWGPMPEWLQEKTGMKVIAPDLPGFGEEYELAPPTKIKDTMEIVRAKVKAKLKPEEKLHIVGVSLGGMVVHEWLRHYPEELNSFVLINSSFGSCSPFYKRLRWQIYKQIVDLSLIQVPRERERKILEIVANSADRREEVFLDWVKIAQDRPWKPMNVLKQILGAALYRPPLVEAKIPGLIVSSLGDRLMDPSCPKALAKVLKVPMVSHPWGGHDLGVDDPKWLVDRLVEFWRAAIIVTK